MRKLIPWTSVSPVSRCFLSYLQKFLGRPSPVHVHLQAAVKKVSEHGRESLWVLQLWCPVCSYQIQCLETKETGMFCSYPEILTRTLFLSSNLHWQFLPWQRAGDGLHISRTTTKKPQKILMQSQLFKCQNDLALTADFIG